MYPAGLDYMSSSTTF